MQNGETEKTSVYLCTTNRFDAEQGVKIKGPRALPALQAEKILQPKRG